MGICAKCHARKALSSHRWCRQCKAVYMREWRQRNGKTLKEQVFYAGVCAMRKSLAESFSAIGDAQLSGFAAAKIVNMGAVRFYGDRQTFHVPQE